RLFGIRGTGGWGMLSYGAIRFLAMRSRLPDRYGGCSRSRASVSTRVMPAPPDRLVSWVFRNVSDWLLLVAVLRGSLCSLTCDAAYTSSGKPCEKPRSYERQNLPALRHVSSCVHFVLCDFGRSGQAYVETDPSHADASTIVRNLLDGQNNQPVRVLALNV